MTDMMTVSTDTMEELKNGKGNDPQKTPLSVRLKMATTALLQPQYTNSPLVNYKRLSPNNSGPRNHKIDTITIHHMAGALTVEQCGAIFADPSRQASANYGVDGTGRVGLYVEEKNRAWTSSSYANDNRAVTIEVANSQIGGNWAVSDKALSKLVELCADICQRNGIKHLVYTGDTSGNMTLHQWFAPTLCPGPYLKAKMPYIATEVNKRLVSKSKYTVKGLTVPKTVKAGHAFTCKGIITSANPLKRVEIGITDSTGNKWTRQKVDKTIKAGHTFNIYALADADLLFTELKKGTYYYRCWCWDANGAKLIFNRKFKVV